MSRMLAFCTIGSMAAFDSMEPPSISMSIHGDRHQPQPGWASPASRIATIAATTSPPPALSPARAMRPGPEALRQQKTVSGDSVLDRGGKRMLGCEPVVERQRHAVGGTPEFGDHVTVAVERAEQITAAMDVKDRCVAHRTGGRGPFGR